jgi:hypothetical protein
MLDFMQPVIAKPAVKIDCGVGMYILDSAKEEDRRIACEMELDNICDGYEKRNRRKCNAGNVNNDAMAEL